MQPSQTVIDSWKAEGQAEGVAAGMALGMVEARRADILRTLQLRYGVVPPTDISAAVRGMDDIDRLSRWFDAAVVSMSIESFRELVKFADGKTVVD